MKYILKRIENVFGTVKDDGSFIIEGTVVTGIEGDKHGFEKLNPISIEANRELPLNDNYQKLVDRSNQFVSEIYPSD